ncbi:MAG: hypothetical protein M1828_003523 [Chrysothrix sp. TS-e1954]|nr:MAG: hypothetical protein M1828_003523 [Chrysothrix sp. TS-e1954]
MIRRGKAQGWLSLSRDDFRRWASWNDIEFRGVDAESVGSKGQGLLATVAQDGASEEEPLVVVPRSLILSKENVWLQSKSDKHLQSVLDAVGDFANTSRGSIQLFLLVQSTYACPDVQGDVGVQHPLLEYVKSLPMELLPTFWNDAERDLLEGTSLAEALDAKLSILHREFDNVREATSSIPWCQDHWWDETSGLLEFDDWKQVDAMYRSRALEFPGIGDCMVPIIDLANHASETDTVARYETNGDGNAILVLHAKTRVDTGSEITITYGDKKGACEMIFSYGFLEEDLNNARSVILSLTIPNDDPLKQAKLAVMDCAPGCFLTLDPESGKCDWKSEYVWPIIVNEEDGLHFQIAQTQDGQRELHATWQDEPIGDLSDFQDRLKVHPMWDLFRLRAMATIQGRVQDQLMVLHAAQDRSAEADTELSLRDRPRNLAIRLRHLETSMLEAVLRTLQQDIEHVANLDVVRQYLEGHAEEVHEVDDFS